MAREIPIKEERIRLGQLLKLAGLIDSGSEAKALLASEPLWVNGERETRRGRQLAVGDTVRVGDGDLLVTAIAPTSA
ncbi:MAG TPA: RNA-binding S4 domain-containing protein [Solirubrobacteraceae bacterium]|nr:RNA-binding S4 domain-containing protein [Solirubrobacteraceae bacterium]